MTKTTIKEDELKEEIELVEKSLRETAKSCDDYTIQLEAIKSIKLNAELKGFQEGIQIGKQEAEKRIINFLKKYLEFDYGNENKKGRKYTFLCKRKAVEFAKKLREFDEELKKEVKE